MIFVRQIFKKRRSEEAECDFFGGKFVKLCGSQETEFDFYRNRACSILFFSSRSLKAKEQTGIFQNKAKLPRSEEAKKRRSKTALLST